jgi:Kef-type K+ transport system membrane component KefB
MTPPVPPFGGTALLLFLVQVCLLLTIALILGRLATRLGLAAIVGELLTGILLGPSVLGALAPGVAHALFPARPEQAHLLDAFGTIGVIMLVALTGMQLDLGLIRKRARTAVGISLPGLVIPFALGIGAGYLLPESLVPVSANHTALAVFLGVAMCVSAIPVIAKTLMDLRLLHRNVGQLILMSGTIDDLVGWIGLSMVTAMATGGLHAAGLLRSVGWLIAFLALAALAGRPLVRTVMRRTLRSSDGGVTLMVAVVVILAFAAAGHGLHLEAVVGALVAGVLVRQAGPQVLVRLAPLRPFTMSVLAPVFFAIAGLRVDLTLLAKPQLLVCALALLAAAIVGKFAGAGLGSWLCGLTRWEGLAVGAGMNARGVIEVVVATVGLTVGVLDVGLYSVIVLIAIVTSFMSPPILRLATSRIAESEDERLRRHELATTLEAGAVPATTAGERSR